MDDGRKKLKICLALMLIAAIAAGAIYYFKYMPYSGEKVNEGTLIRTDNGEMEADNWTEPTDPEEADVCVTGAAAMRNADGK